LRIWATSRGLIGDTGLALALGAPVQKAYGSAQLWRSKPSAGPAQSASYAISEAAEEALAGDRVVGWGRKANTAAARAFARHHGLPFVALEDGFIAYRGHRESPRLAIVQDPSGIYYDARSPSHLETLIATSPPLTGEQRARITAVLDRIRLSAISKYNGGLQALPGWLQAEISAADQVVLVVDQSAGDQSVTGALAAADSFHQMLVAAREENPDALILVKVHPDVLSGKARGHVSHVSAADASVDCGGIGGAVRLVADDIAPQRLLAAVDRVYVVSSQYGFEALIAGKPVTCFGMPFYAGWGLTDDRLAVDAEVAARRGAVVDTATLAHRALIDYTTYIDPYQHRRAEIEDILDILEADVAVPGPVAARSHAVDFTLWKRAFIADFLPKSAGSVLYAKAGKAIRRARKDGAAGGGDAVIAWSRKSDAALAALPDSVPVWRMEDGFIRSAGLGSDLKRPASLVVDRRGLYFDARQPSDLEHFLETATISDAQRARADRLVAALIAAGVSKYNVGRGGIPDVRSAAGGRDVVLVPGQVEGDASLRFGAPDISTNSELLKAVRARCPDAYILYKPHPDVLSGNREDMGLDAEARGAFDLQILDVDILDCVAAADSVHVMTSLAGFEALIRGRSVVTYGLPFYAGWGLTEDRVDCPRRTRRLTLQDLVYGAMIAYPRYVDPVTGQPTTPEAIVGRLAGDSSGRQIEMSALRRFLRKMGFLFAALLR